MKQTMTHRERIEAVIRGEKPDRIPIAFWRHFPHLEQTAEGLAKATVEFQKAYDFDLVKVTPISGYIEEAWKAKLNYKNNAEGTRDYIARPVNSAEDWHRLKPLEVTHSILARELLALQLIRRGVGEDVHVLQTIFSPLTAAKHLSGDLLLQHFRRHPDDLKTGLQIVMETSSHFAISCLDHGADGIFFATQFASHDLLSVEEYREFGLKYDLPIIEATREKSDLTLLHLHGSNPMFALLDSYPVQIVNWEDRETSPSLAEGLRLFPKGAVLGGLHRHKTLPPGTPKDIQAEVRDAILQTRGVRLIIGTGCVMPITTPNANIKVARNSVEQIF